MQYVIDGTGDFEVNKMILYSANNSKEFKDKLRCYEIRWKMKPKRNEKELQKDKKLEIRCFNCGKNVHNSTDCENKSN